MLLLKYSRHSLRNFIHYTVIRPPPPPSILPLASRTVPFPGPSSSNGLPIHIKQVFFSRPLQARRPASKPFPFLPLLLLYPLFNLLPYKSSKLFSSPRQKPFYRCKHTLSPPYPCKHFFPPSSRPFPPYSHTQHVPPSHASQFCDGCTSLPRMHIVP